VVETKSTKDVLARLIAQEGPPAPGGSGMSPSAATAAAAALTAADNTVKKLERELRQLKDNYEDMELENLRLLSDNQRLRTSSTLLNTKHRRDNDDENDVITESKTTLVGRIKLLDSEKMCLRDELTALKDRTTKLFGEVADLKKPAVANASSFEFSHKLPTTLYGLEEECRRLKIRVVEMEVENAQLVDEMKVIKEKRSDGDADVLKEKIAELETENSESLNNYVY